MTTTYTNREILKSYFRGIIDLQIEYMNNYPDMNNDYRRENEAFIKAVKTALDEFSNKLSLALKEMYVAKYRDNKPFIEFYNVVAPTGYIMALNKELNALVSKIERPKQRLYA
ncbi:hypothetical protein WZ78_00720 [Leuconostoc mesenteroides subsp. dextranicum]|uniref:hypothetical protein n=1 Tax=Leuconostoc mesenteroides TaxID=1245 RepID=UPI00068302EA|nr:hypothetical protein [Leuconostoc mesenteroides]KMY78107.1 hypothetical protein WZ79_03715 [Leuconostoc mesenteroides subsp. mesenteroides]KMY82409.1 hypothetical protein WZ78_00720 [Leuconostoc mesenteroides subsp. dextranicum]